ncbi:50S ribosomal protein L4 [Gracilimonas tropica]|uniref:50S ribosomal protein L4 n=1 Tax=Gracilimonas tropica TaxID=454600 RepID=UPI00035CBB1E|nr:50S ribosomal protein L4 [Gracilimonas tropica]
MKVDIYKIDGSKSSKKAELSDTIFAIEPNEVVLYEDVRRHLANKRQGTAKTKERGEVTGSTKKMYRQKGTGNARRGDIKSPLLRSGGTVFGPKPRNYGFKLNKKTRQLARKSALSLKAANEGILVIEDFSFDEPKTSKVANMLDALKASGKKALILTAETDHIVYKSARNIPGVHVLESYKPTTYEIMNADVIVIQEGAIMGLENSIEPKNEEAVA